MSERLVIRDFGPIQSLDIELRDLTCFVGPQATGKSLAAQVLFFLSSVQDYLDVVPEDVETPAEAALEAMGWWLGNEVSVYVGPGTLLRWEGDVDTRRQAREMRWRADGVELSRDLADALQPHQRRLQPELPSPRVYIPGGRTLYSYFPTYTRTFARAAREWPGYAQTFIETLGVTVRVLWKTAERHGHGQQTLLEHFAPFNFTFCKQRIETILKGRVRYGPDAVALDIGRNRLLNAATLASGQMETWPVWAIVEALAYGLYSVQQICIEEPEAHLHPEAQRAMLEVIAHLANSGLRFLLTTHSPYVVYAINTFLLAYQALQAGRPLPASVPLESALSAAKVAAYRFSEDGVVYNIADPELGLISEEELDRVADELGASFTALQELLWEGAPV